jgi:hypothetical protein
MDRALHLTEKTPRATKPDHWKSVTRIKLPVGFKAHKSADSGVPVGGDASRCRLHEVTLSVFKRWRLNGADAGQ